MSPPSSPTAGSPAAARAPEARAHGIVAAARKRPLDPIDRYAEIIFGLVMALTFTGTLRVAESGREQVGEMLIAALGCNLAWGVVDGVMYVVTSFVDRARRLAVIEDIRAASPEAAGGLVLAALPETVAAFTDPAEAERLAVRLRAAPAPGLRRGITWEDLRGALAACLLTILATLPPAIPFLLVDDVRRALALSNGVAVAAMFLAGWGLGRSTGVRPWALGLAMVFVGAGLVGVTIALGG
jgi:hypothetical protein